MKKLVLLNKQNNVREAEIHETKYGWSMFVRMSELNIDLMHFSNNLGMQFTEKSAKNSLTKRFGYTMKWGIKS